MLLTVFTALAQEPLRYEPRPGLRQVTWFPALPVEVAPGGEWRSSTPGAECQPVDERIAIALEFPPDAPAPTTVVCERADVTLTWVVTPR